MYLAFHGNYVRKFVELLRISVSVKLDVYLI